MLQTHILQQVKVV